MARPHNTVGSKTFTVALHPKHVEELERRIIA
jgi:hypothetical protein